MTFFETHGIILYPTLVFLYAISLLVVFGVITLENRQPVKTISWILVILLIPGLGIAFYIFFGQNYRKEKIIAKKGLKNHDVLLHHAHAQIDGISTGVLLHEEKFREYRSLIQMLINNSTAVFTKGNIVTVFNNGRKTYDSLLEALTCATKFIHIEYYIFENDKIGRQIAELLKKKASEGVEIRMIVDDVGSWALKESFFKEMRNAGVEIYSFLRVKFPMFTSKVNYRNHRKIVIIDGEIGYMGGINVADRYLEGDSNSYGIWRDTHLKIEGDAIHTLHSIFLLDWYFVSQTELYDQKYFPAARQSGNAMVQVVSSGPDTDWPAIMMGFFKAITSAKHYVYIQTPYFMPTESMITALKTAALGGVDVKIVIPFKSDGYITLLSSRSYIKEMLESGIKIFFYKKGFIHCKTLIIDDYISTVGSANMDFRSFEQNWEVTSFVYDYETAMILKNDFEEDLSHSQHVFHDEWIKRPIIEKTKESFCRLLSPLL